MAINMRAKYLYRMTNSFSRNGHAAVLGAWSRGTPRQIVAARDELIRVSGGCDTAVQVEDADGAPLWYSDLLDAVQAADAKP